jgi:hydrogenase maturation protein HypF
VYCRITINGVVQGIGFRPFVYNTAVSFNLTGYVLNRGDAGVEIQVEGSKKQIESFISALNSQKPNLAKYEVFEIDYHPETIQEIKGETFRIAESSLSRGSEGSYIPPDLPICDKCLSEMKTDPRRKNYPFTSCVDCGPRYTVISSLPYDRPRTVMNEFPLCSNCLSEYTDPANRRFHAQTTCCWICGPRYFLVDKSGEVILSKEEFKEKWFDTVKILNENKIIAIKGIGGTHLACGTLVEDPIQQLRGWKGARGDKPFAVMSPDLKRVKQYAVYNPAEAKYLQSLARPIVLINKNDTYPLSRLISPKLHNIGVMLPYAGIHHLITNNIADPALIMTSGNPSNMPILIQNETIITRLSSIADYFLLHDRKIHQRADDSVLRIHSSKESTHPVLIRRSRGYIPEPIQLPWNSQAPSVLALGAEMYNVGALGIGKRCFATQHIGHMTTLENIDFFNDTIKHMKDLIGIKNFEGICSDLHPQFQTTLLGKEFAKELNIPFYQFQHHFAHLGALALDNNIDPEEKIICVALDGTGYGEDGNIWGGEILLGNYSEYKRMAHLQNQILLGGDQAVNNPFRVLLASLLATNNLDELSASLEKIPWLSWIPKTQNYSHICNLLNNIVANKITEGYSITSSCGRLLDSISILLGASKTRTYEGEPAIKLESLAEKAYGKKDISDLRLNTKVHRNGIIEILTSTFTNRIFELIQQGANRAVIALAAEQAIARKFAEIALDIAENYGISKIGMSGGVCYNRVLFTEFVSYINTFGDSKYLLSHKRIPCGDGGVAMGQIPLIQAQLI